MVSSDKIDELIEGSYSRGCKAAKISGAGGGGFAFFITDLAERHRLSRYIESQGYTIFPFTFVEHGAITWRSEHA